MQSITFQFPAGKINAALLFAASNDVRYSLNGVMFTKAPDGKGIMAVATDGHRLCAIYHAQEVKGLPDFQVIIPRDELATIAKSPIKAGRHAFDIAFSVSQVQRPDEKREGVTVIGKPRVTMKGAVTVECDTVDGRFPDWQRVIPAADLPINERGAGSCHGLNAAYLADYAKAYKALGGGKLPCIRMNQRADGCALLITLSGMPDFVSVLMPAREDAPTMPGWLTAPAAEIKAPYEERVAKLEAEGLSTSDAQAAVEAEDMKIAA